MHGSHRLLLAALLAIVSTGCTREPPPGTPLAAPERILRVGYASGPLAAPLYVAAQKARAEAVEPWLEAVEFETSGNVGYALLAGELDAGLLEPAKALSLIKADARQGLRVAGSVQFPYGASLILRKDLALRLGDLGGRRIAASTPGCRLLHQFRADLKRLVPGAEPPHFVFMPFDDMLPALEAREVDAALTKGVHALIGEKAGHKVLYQNWDMAAGDECCPALVAELELLLVVAPLGDGAIRFLVDRLQADSQASPAVVRQLIAEHLRLPPEQLSGYPPPTFVPVNQELRGSLRGFAWEPEHGP